LVRVSVAFAVCVAAVEDDMLKVLELMPVRSKVALLVQMSFVVGLCFGQCGRNQIPEAFKRLFKEEIVIAPVGDHLSDKPSPDTL